MAPRSSATRSVAVGLGKGLAWGIPVAFGVTLIYMVITFDMDTGGDYNLGMFFVLVALALVVSVRSEVKDRSNPTVASGRDV